MGKTIEAIYEDGVLRPVEPVELREGERVQVTIEELAPEIRRRLAAVEAFESEFEDLSEERWKEFEQAVQRRPLFGKRKLNLSRLAASWTPTSSRLT